MKFIESIKKMFVNFFFYLRNIGKMVDIKKEHRHTSHGFYGDVVGFNSGKVTVSVFDMGMRYRKEFDADQLEETGITLM